MSTTTVDGTVSGQSADSVLHSGDVANRSVFVPLLEHRQHQDQCVGIRGQRLKNGMSVGVLGCQCVCLFKHGMAQECTLVCITGTSPRGQVLT